MSGSKSISRRRRAAAVLSAVLAVSLFASCGKGSGQKAETVAAVEYLRQLESGSPDAVVAVIRQQQKDRLAAEREALREQLLAGEIDVWSQFQDYIILGDSRASGFWYYSWLPEERCLAESGDTIYTLEGHIDDVVRISPARIYVSYGMNDLGSWTAEEYAEKMVSIFDALREKLPELEIYVNSIIPVEEWAIKYSYWRDVPEWNEALRQMCREHGYTFVDNDQLIADNPLYEGDGIHFFSSFYPLWGTNMILATYYRGAEEELEV